MDGTRFDQLPEAPGGPADTDTAIVRRAGVGVVRTTLAAIAALVQTLRGGIANGLATLGEDSTLVDAQIPSIRRLPEWRALEPEPGAYPPVGSLVHLDETGMFADYCPKPIVSTNGVGVPVEYSTLDRHCTFVHSSEGDMSVLITASGAPVPGVTNTVVEGTAGFVAFFIAGPDTDPPQTVVGLDSAGTTLGPFTGTASGELFRLSGKGKRCTVERISETLTVVNGNIELPPP